MVKYNQSEPVDAGICEGEWKEKTEQGSACVLWITYWACMGERFWMCEWGYGCGRFLLTKVGPTWTFPLHCVLSMMCHPVCKSPIACYQSIFNADVLFGNQFLWVEQLHKCQVSCEVKAGDSSSHNHYESQDSTHRESCQMQCPRNTAGQLGWRRQTVIFLGMFFSPNCIEWVPSF